MIAKGGYVYMVSNKHRTTIYIGVTSNLSARSWEHKNGEGSSFTKKYNCTDLIYYEFHESIESAIEREKELKKWKRFRKERLIKTLNPSFLDLHENVREFT